MTDRGRGKGEVAVGLWVQFQFCKRKNSGDWLNNNVNMLNTVYLKTIKMVNFVMCIL